jgi:hypothetical protein
VKKKQKKIFDFPEVKPILSHISYEESKNRILMVNKKKNLLEFLKHPNVKVPYEYFTQNNLFRLYFGSITAKATLLSLIG